MFFMISRIVARARRATIVCLLTSMGLSTAYSQSSATIAGSQGEVTAGDVVQLILTFDEAATCSETVGVSLIDTQRNNGLSFRGQLEPGKNTATLTVTVPKDFRGEFHTEGTSSFLLFPCDGYSQNKTFSATPVTLNVKGITDPNKYPLKADVVLSLTQKQFLDTKAKELNDLSSQIDTRVETSGIDSVELRKFLTDIVERAEADLNVTEREYRVKLLKPNDPSPAFFADFRRQYDHLHIELKAPIPGTRASLEQSAHVLNVQQPLQRRSPSPTKAGNQSGTSPSIARTAKAIVNDNASAYNIVNSTGRALFHAQFSSIPAGATLYYRQAILPDFSTWSSKTDISGADFVLATFVFKFHQDECADEPVVTVDPYDDIHPNVSVEFKHCGKK